MLLLVLHVKQYEVVYKSCHDMLDAVGGSLCDSIMSVTIVMTSDEVSLWRPRPL